MGGIRVGRDSQGVRGGCVSIYYSLFKWTGTEQAGTFCSHWREGSHVSYTTSWKTNFPPYTRTQQCNNVGLFPQGQQHSCAVTTDARHLFFSRLTLCSSLNTATALCVFFPLSKFCSGAVHLDLNKQEILLCACEIMAKHILWPPKSTGRNTRTASGTWLLSTSVSRYITRFGAAHWNVTWSKDMVTWLMLLRKYGFAHKPHVAGCC
jgi:hypothetical protein